eukprot:COSAG01_NODE_39709_length_473_cov_0.516043_1_plen_116_part_00
MSKHITNITHLCDDILGMISDNLVARRRDLPVHGNKTNSRVIYSWMNSKPWKSLRMSTDGFSLYSYNLEIGHTKDGKKVLKDYTAKGLGCYSQTTSTHVNMCKKYADKIIDKNNI